MFWIGIAILTYIGATSGERKIWKDREIGSAPEKQSNHQSSLLGIKKRREIDISNVQYNN